METTQDPPATSRPCAPRKAAHTILFLAANPGENARLALDREASAIQVELERCGCREHFKFETRWAAKPMDLLRELSRLSPTLVHFSGHGACDGLVFHGPEGHGPRSVDPGQLREAFAVAGASVRVAVLNAGFSEVHARELTSQVACVVGAEGPVVDEHARAFAIGFYGALGDNHSVNDAFRQGMAAIRLHSSATDLPRRDVSSGGSPEAAAPSTHRLFVRDGVDASEIYLDDTRNVRTRIELVIKATLDDFDAVAIDRLREQLRLLSGDVTLEIVEIRRGSVRVTLSLSVDAAARLVELAESGELDSQCGYSIAVGSTDFALGSGTQNHATSRAGFAGKETAGALDADPRVSGALVSSLDNVNRIGTQIGVYRVLQQIGKGGMGTVWLADHVMLRRRAAIKLLHPMYTGRPDIVTRFFNEARAAAAISDPGIVQIFDFGYHTDGTAYIAMELLDGEPLDRRVRRLGKLALGDSLRIVHQIASTLGVAHARGIIHRDVKPENVFLVHDPEVAGGERAKILDFGIAKLTLAPSETHDSVVMGTPTYMSPEQCRGARQVDPRSDVYSLGCLLFTLITGGPPFQSTGPGDVIAMHLRELSPMPSSRAHSVPPAVDALVGRCLEKDPARRFASGVELAAAIGRLTGNADGEPHTMTAALMPWAPAPSPSTVLSVSRGSTLELDTDRRHGHRIRNAAIAVAAIAAITVIAILVTSWTGGGNRSVVPPPPPVVPDAAVPDAAVPDAAAPVAAKSDPAPIRDAIVGLSRFGFFSIAATAKTQIFIDDNRIGEAPLTRLPLTPGPHKVTAIGPRGRVKLIDIVIYGGRDTDEGTITW